MSIESQAVQDCNRRPILIAVAGHTQTISACAKKNGGALREVSNQNQCKKNETFVSWEKQANAWNLTGNTGTSAATNFVGTTDDQPLEFRVNGARVMRLEPALAGVHGFIAPNVVGGASSNTVGSGVIGPLSSAGAFGGLPNSVQAAFGTIGGGFENTVPDSGFFGTVAGDTGNSSSGFGDTVGGGGNNSATGGYATVAGGFENVASGGDSAVCGGVLNIAGDAASFAGGQQAQALHDGSFVWNDFSTIGNPFKDSTANQFNVRASGGVRFFLADDYAAGYSLGGGGTGWSCSSDRASKEHFSPVDKEQILQAVARLPIQSWNVKAQGPAVRHIGPTTQDFHDAFRLSAEDKTINRIDADGVALAAIQQMYELLKEQDGKSGPWRRGGGPKTRPSGRSMRACGPSNRS